MEIYATMTLQSCQLIGVAEGLTISYPNFLKYISRAPSEHTGTNIREVSSDEKKNREVSAWSYNSSMVSAGR